MRILSLALLCATLLLCGCGQPTRVANDSPGAPGQLASISNQSVEVGCAMCIYDMSGVSGCTLAAVVDDRPMLVSGVDVNLHEHGLCSGSGRAVVSGRVEGDELVATGFRIE